MLVVGGGPAGSAAAFAASRGGGRVLLLDREDFPRPKLCGGALTAKALRLLEEHLGLTPETLRSQGALRGEADRFEFFWKRDPVHAGPIRPSLRFADRARLDDLLLRRAREAGAEVRTGTGVRSVDPRSGTVRTDSGETLRGRRIVGADGAVGPCGRAARFAFPGGADPLTRLCFALEALVPREHFREFPAAPRLHWGLPREGYAWVFPRGTEALVGLGGARREEWPRYPALLREFCAALLHPSVPPPRARGALIPSGLHPAEPEGVGVMLLCGDAAGLVHPLTGEGIPYALESGLAAGEASLRGLSEGPEAARADYRERLGRRILPELLRCRRGRGLFFLDLGPLSPPLFRLAFRLRGPRFERALHWGLR